MLPFHFMLHNGMHEKLEYPRFRFFRKPLLSALAFVSPGDMTTDSVSSQPLENQRLRWRQPFLFTLSLNLDQQDALFEKVGPSYSVYG
jgi:hypothetical protein